MRKSYRVKSEKDFQLVFETGQSMANKAFVLYQLDKVNQPHFRVGISVGKKVGHNAVLRNRIKRCIRAAITEDKHMIKKDVDFLVIARPYVKDLDMKCIKANLEHVMKLSNLLLSDIPSQVEEN